MTFGQAHQRATRGLLNHDYERDEAHSTARILLDAVTNTPYAHLTYGECPLTENQQLRFEQSLAELERGRPLPYILGAREFFGLTFVCDERALIPRPETELLVEFALRTLEILPPHHKPWIADLGTGSGCIAIALAKHCADATVFATEAALPAVALARENASTHGVDARLQFVLGMCGEWSKPLDEYTGRFDVIVSNPPYIAPCDIETLQTQVKDHEPRSALDGGADGLECYRQIASQCARLLAPNGVLACELGRGQFAAVRAIFMSNGWVVGDAIYDLQGIARVIVAHPATTLHEVAVA